MGKNTVNNNIRINSVFHILTTVNLLLPHLVLPLNLELCNKKHGDYFF